MNGFITKPIKAVQKYTLPSLSSQEGRHTLSLLRSYRENNGGKFTQQNIEYQGIMGIYSGVLGP